MWVPYPKAEKAVKKHKTAYYKDASVSIWRLISGTGPHGAEEEVRPKGSEAVLFMTDPAT